MVFWSLCLTRPTSPISTDNIQKTCSFRTVLSKFFAKSARFGQVKMYGPADHAVNYDSNILEQVKGQEGSGRPQLLGVIRRDHVARM